MLKLFIITILVISFRLEAAFQEIWQGYQMSSVYQSQLLDEKLVEANYLFEQNKFDWKLELTPKYDNSYLDALFSFQAQNTITNSLEMALTKSSYRYGSFSFRHIYTSYDLSRWSQNSFSTLSSDQLFESRNIFSYSYDFLDRSLDKDFELVEINKNQGSLEAKLKLEQGYLDFFTVYLQAKYQVFAVELTKEFVARAKRRVNLTAKRVKDGTSRKVEYSLAETSLLNQQEALENARSQLKQNLAVLENILGKNITEDYFKKISWAKNDFNYWSKAITPSEHISLELIKQKLAISEKNLEKIADQSGVKLILNTNYISNDIDPNHNETISTALRGERDSKNISLNLVVPLGTDKDDGLRLRYAYQKKKNEYDLLTKKDELKSNNEALKARIVYLENSLKFADNKIALTQKIVDEQNTLYLRGQASFEEVIRAEENYINAQINQKRLLAEYETLIANYAFINNSIKSILDLYQD